MTVKGNETEAALPSAIKDLRKLQLCQQELVCTRILRKVGHSQLPSNRGPGKVGVQTGEERRTGLCRVICSNLTNPEAHGSQLGALANLYPRMSLIPTCSRQRHLLLLVCRWQTSQMAPWKTHCQGARGKKKRSLLACPVLYKWR